MEYSARRPLQIATNVAGGSEEQPVLAQLTGRVSSASESVKSIPNLRPAGRAVDRARYDPRPGRVAMEPHHVTETIAV
jgi:hypothetical protein